jgi:hypothetical protein
MERSIQAGKIRVSREGLDLAGSTEERQKDDNVKKSR